MEIKPSVSPGHNFQHHLKFEEILVSTDEFEYNLRHLYAQNPRLSLSAALSILDNAEGEIIDFPEDVRDYEQGALWALQQPDLVEELRLRSPIYAVKTVRALAPERQQQGLGYPLTAPTTLHLVHAKNIVERARDLLNEKREN